MTELIVTTGLKSNTNREDTVTDTVYIGTEEVSTVVGDGVSAQDLETTVVADFGDSVLFDSEVI